MKKKQPLPPKKFEFVSVRCTVAEHVELKALAKGSGLTVSEYIRTQLGLRKASVERRVEELEKRVARLEVGEDE